jgi:hypothetical protein
MKGYLAVAMLDIEIDGQIISFDRPNEPIGVMGIYATREAAEAMSDTVVEVLFGDLKKEENELH